MAKLDRLGWAGGASFSAYGRLIGIRVSDRDALSLVPSRLPFGWNPSAKRKVDHLYSLILGGPGAAAGVRRFNLLYAGSVRVARSLDPVEVLDALESDLHRYVAQTSRRHVFVHAGAVGWRGRAIVIPGASMSGKTTLVSAFVRAGATYYSDEYTVLDSNGRVRPYLKPLSIRSAPAARTVKYPIEALGGVAGTKPLEVGWILVTGYREGACWRPRLLSPGHAMLELLARTVPVRQRPRTVLATLRRAIVDARTLKSSRGEAEEVVQSVLRYGSGYTRAR